MNKNINELRKEIDKIDDNIADLFEKRMSLVEKISREKKSTKKKVRDQNRENKIIERVTKGRNTNMIQYMKTLYSVIFSLSRSYQNSKINSNGELSSLIKTAEAKTPEAFPKTASVACQGIEGAFSQLACEKIFNDPEITYFKNFDAVFSAVEQGLCRYGILPIENSANGSVTQVYDLMKKRNFFITSSIKLKVDHCLLVKDSTNISDIKKIYSHEQAIGQSSVFLEKLDNVEIEFCENTATGARMVKESDDKGVAAIASRESGEAYGLNILFEDIQNAEENYTRFICISKNPEMYPDADKISIMFTVPHEPGELYEVMSKFAANQLNITKLESRPIAEKDFEFMFYFDFEGSTKQKNILDLLDDLNNNISQFKFLGNYGE